MNMNINKDLSRRVKLTVHIGGHDATSYVEPYLLSFSYTDNASDKADEIQLTLHDRDGLWNGQWRPQKGTVGKAMLTLCNWENEEEKAINYGDFIIDEISFNGPPDVVTIKAVSASLSSSLRDQTNTRAWENSDMQFVASEIAKQNNLELVSDLFTTGFNNFFKRKDQREESDLSFLNRTAKENGYNLKVHDGKLVLFDVRTAEEKPARLTIHKAGSLFSPSSYSFSEKSADTAYTACEVQYLDLESNELFTYQHTKGQDETTGEKILRSNQRVESLAEAQSLAESLLHTQNKKEIECSFECMGNIALVAGINIQLDGFGYFSGKYFIEQSTHTIENGYRTSVKGRLCS